MRRKSLTKVISSSSNRKLESRTQLFSSLCLAVCNIERNE
ncbi:hypothetical protein COI_2428 [Mannheimia haemolytica serotype A2 str. OVINE]|nr:hypothetical protein COI_2428 [Mannheimia haemolytica serotype A2 str. OVINE]